MKRLVQISGGYDSAAALLMTLREYPSDEIALLQVNYGQAYLSKEAAAVDYLIDRLSGFNSFAWDYYYARCEMLPGQSGVRGESVAEHYVPVRNAVLAAMSLNYAVAIGAKEIVVGMKRDFTPDPDPFFYRDSGGTFYAAMNAVSSACVEFKDFPAPKFVAPLNRNGNPMTKTECMTLLLEHGIELGRLWSCSSDEERCLKCHMCEGVLKAIAPLGINL